MDTKELTGCEDQPAQKAACCELGQVSMRDTGIGLPQGMDMENN